MKRSNQNTINFHPPSIHGDAADSEKAGDDILLGGDGNDLLKNNSQLTWSPKIDNLYQLLPIKQSNNIPQHRAL